MNAAINSKWSRWTWYPATDDEITRVKTTRGNRPQRRLHPAADGFNYWYDEDGRAVLRYREDVGSEIRVWRQA